MTGMLGKRGERRRTLIAGTAAATLALVAVVGVLFWPQSSEPEAALPDESHHSGETDTEIATGPGSALVIDMSAAEVIEPPIAESAGDIPQSSLAEAAASQTSRTGADGLGQPRGDVDPSEVISSDAALGGCHEAYGEDGQCLPTIPPSLAAHAAEMDRAGLDPTSMPHHWTCAEVDLSFPDGIAVRVAGVDPDGLDTDLDGVACGPGD